MNEPRPWQREADRLGNVDPTDPTGWFEQLWASASDGEVTTPWDHDDPHPTLAAWVAGDGRRFRGRRRVRPGRRRRAPVPARLPRRRRSTSPPLRSPRPAARHPGSPVTYAVGDLLDLPREWLGGFDLVVEIYTVQAVNRSVRGELTAGVRSLVAPGGTLLVVQAVADEPDDDGPPWPLTRSEIEAFGRDGLSAVSIEELAVPGAPGRSRDLAGRVPPACVTLRRRIRARQANAGPSPTVGQVITPPNPSADATPSLDGRTAGLAPARQLRARTPLGGRLRQRARRPPARAADRDQHARRTRPRTGTWTGSRRTWCSSPPTRDERDPARPTADDRPALPGRRELPAHRRRSRPGQRAPHRRRPPARRGRLRPPDRSPPLPRGRLVPDRDGQGHLGRDQRVAHQQFRCTPDNPGV